MVLEPSGSNRQSLSIFRPPSYIRSLLPKAFHCQITAGQYRFKVAFRLRMPDAPCIIVTEDDLNAELAIIDENLCRTDMTLAERARIMARRKELYEEKHPETKNGAIGNGRS